MGVTGYPRCADLTHNRAVRARRHSWGVATLWLAGCGDSGLFAESADAGWTRPSPDSAVVVAPDGAVAAPADAVADAARNDALADATPADAVADAGPAEPPSDGAVGVPADAGRLVYPADRAHSPLGPVAAEALRAIAARAPSAAADVFAKVGDSITVSRAFLDCFDGGGVELDAHADLEPARAHFAAGDAAGTSPYSRASEAATVGWSVGAAMRGAPSPLERELGALNPTLAVVMFGTNDLQSRAPNAYFSGMRALVDALVGRGVVPLMSTIPPRDDSALADADVPLYNGIVRALAQSRRVPLMDLHRALMALPGHGMGPDNLHPSASPEGACALTASGLQSGYNQRNLLTLEALDRAWRALRSEPAPDAEGPMRRGDGSGEAPIEIDALPFAELGDTRSATTRRIDRYVGCQSQADESGPEHIYRLTLDAPRTVRAVVVDGEGVDVDLHLMVDPGDAATCLERHDREVEADLGEGVWYFVVDTYVADGGPPQAGEYALVVFSP